MNLMLVMWCLVNKGAVFLLFLVTWLDSITTGEEKKEHTSSFLWKKNVKEGELCNDLIGCYLGWGGLTNPL